MEFTTEQLTTRWEDQRAIKNLMGKYANLVLLNREGEVFDLLWSENEPQLGFNDGWYLGADAVRGYYDACVERNALVASLLQKRFPEKLGDKTAEEIYGVGPFKVEPMASPIIEVAADGQTAKGLWCCQGARNDVETCGPRARWTWGWFAVDFVKEASGWRIWHMRYEKDVDRTCGQTWGAPEEAYPALPEFAPLGGFQYPPYTAAETLRVLYSPERPLTEAPRIPEPYASFGETFTYGREANAS
ncbi:MAG: nuclear transport factor 2 family protein [Oscillospiraceae bacterium]|nr:nuclear transport factor 2 family protein [Oscillospiraceae bacterium]